MSLIVNSLKLGFVHIPKNCGTSFRIWLMSSGQAPEITQVGHHSTLVELTLPEDYTSVAIIRNPWDRIVSYYHFCKHLIDIDSHSNGGAAVRGIQLPYPSFESWLDNIHNVYFVPGRSHDGLRHPFWFTPSTPQSVWIHKDPTILIRHENLAEGIDRVMEATGISKPFPKLNTTNHEHYTEYYNDRTRKIVEKMFALDIDRWGYTFE